MNADMGAVNTLEEVTREESSATQCINGRKREKQEATNLHQSACAGQGPEGLRRDQRQSKENKPKRGEGEVEKPKKQQKLEYRHRFRSWGSLAQNLSPAHFEVDPEPFDSCESDASSAASIFMTTG